MGEKFAKVRYGNGQRKFEIRIFEDNGSPLGKWVINEDRFDNTIKIIKAKFLGEKNDMQDLNWSGL